MSDLDEIRRKRMNELQKQQAIAAQSQQMNQSQEQQEAAMEFEAQKRAMMAKILTSDARTRLTNLRLTKPDLVNNIELQLIQSAQTGSIRGKITDEQLKVLLRNIAGQKRDIKITRK